MNRLNEFPLQPKNPPIPLAWLALTCLTTTAALAQTPPDAGRILQETQQVNQPRLPAEATPPPIALPSSPRAAPPASTPSEARVNVTQFVFVGNQAISQDVLQSAVASYANRALNFGELMQAVEAVEARYKEAGYFLAQAYLPPQKIRDGAIEIVIAEGKLGEARLEGESRIKPEVVFAYLDRLPKGQALTLSKVERQILLINELAGSQAALDLQAGEAEGSTDIVLNQKADPLLAYRIDASNHGSPSTGNNRLGLSVIASSPLNLGDRLSGNFLATNTGDLASYSLRYELPVGPDGWRVFASSSLAEYSLGGSFASLGASGTATSMRLGASYPLLRSRAANWKVQVETDRSQLNDSFTSSNTELGKSSSGVTVTLSGDRQDADGRGFTRMDLALRAGNLDLDASAAALDAPPTGPEAAGGFSKANLTLARQQIVGPNLSAQAQLSYQLAQKNLDSSEKVSFGGPTSLPGYASGEGSGDSGSHLKLGLRWQARSTLALTAFVDYAQVTLAKNPLATATSNEKKLSDIGLTLDWTPIPGLLATFTAAWAGNEAPNPADDTTPRLWLSLAYAW